MKKRTRRTGNLDAWLAAVATPVFVLDASRRVTFFNSGCEQLSGWSAPQVLGLLCDYASDVDPARPDAVAAALAPPPEVLRGAAARAPASLPCRDGASVACVLHFFPLRGDEQPVEGILGIIDLPPAMPVVPESQKWHAALAKLRQSTARHFGIQRLIADDPSMRKVVAQVRLATSAPTPVLIVGEPGVGKEFVARVIHLESRAARRAFVPLDCAVLPAIELKLALKRLYERERDVDDAPSDMGLDPGTLFLANVDALPRDLQDYVLNAEAGEPLDAPRRLRLIASTSADLAEAVEAERVRGDFAEWVSPLVIEIPPLRSRGGDFDLFVQAVLESFNRGDSRQVGGIADDVRRLFREYNWPGNLDELTAVLAEARSTAAGPAIQMQDLPFRFRTGLDAQAVSPMSDALTEPLEALLVRVEREQIERALAQARRNKSKAAKLLGMTRPKLYRRMVALGIEDLEGPES